MPVPFELLDQDANASWKHDGYKVYTTDELLSLLNQGHRVMLPNVDIIAFEQFGFGVPDGNGMSNEIESIEYVGEMPVQCISVDSDDHMYVTDGFIPTHNTANIVFLKSTDDQMLDTLEKMSGKTHQTYRDSKMVSRDEAKLFLKNESMISYTSTTIEEPVISYNDLAFLPERNSIVFIASAPCVWNRNETILPMSWRLYGANTIRQPGREYTLQTIPTLSSAVDFDVRKNQPDFEVMLNHRISQAQFVEEAKKIYQAAYQYTDYEISRLDPDVYSNAIMDIVDQLIYESKGVEGAKQAEAKNIQEAQSTRQHNIVNNDMINATKDAQSNEEDYTRMRYARGLLSRADLIDRDGTVKHGLDHYFSLAFSDAMTKSRMHKDELFIERTDHGINSANGNIPYITRPSSRDAETMAAALRDKNSRVYSDEPLSSSDLAEQSGMSWVITDDFIKFLAEFEDDWMFADGYFADKVFKYMSRDR